MFICRGIGIFLGICQPAWVRNRECTLEAEGKVWNGRFVVLPSRCSRLAGWQGLGETKRKVSIGLGFTDEETEAN